MKAMPYAWRSSAERRLVIACGTEVEDGCGKRNLIHQTQRILRGRCDVDIGPLGFEELLETDGDQSLILDDEHGPTEKTCTASHCCEPQLAFTVLRLRPPAAMVINHKP